MFGLWKRKPAPLTDAQLVVLSAASQRDDLRVVLPERLRGGAADKLLAALKDKGFVEQAHAPPSYLGKAREGWTEFRISPAGLAAIGVEHVDMKRAGEGDARTVEGAGEGCGQDIVSRDAGNDAQPVAVSLTSAPAHRPRLPKRWSMDQPSRNRHKRANKTSLVVELLGRAEGASIEVLQGAAQWLPHTIRAAMTGLRRRGIAVERMTRGDGVSAYRINAARAQAPVEASDLRGALPAIAGPSPEVRADEGRH